MNQLIERINFSIGRKLRSLRRRWLRWQSAHISQAMLLIIISLVMGILIGASAALVKFLIKLIYKTFTWHEITTKTHFVLLILPLAGVVLTSLFQRYIVRGNVASGTHIIQRHLDNGNYCLKPFTILSPIIGCSMTIGFGASAGSEGPVALSGAAIGTNVGRWFGLSAPWLRLLLGIGGGAGIAAIFKSPLGGVLFTLEVLQMRMETLGVIALIIACLFSSASAYVLSGFTFDISFVRVIPFEPRLLGWIALLGVFCGLYCIYYNYTKQKAQTFFTSIHNPWVAALVTGGLLSIGVFLFPTLFGEGFSVITSLVNASPVNFSAYGAFASIDWNKWIWVALVSILLLKSVLVAAAYSGGGVAGDFVPTFFAGAVAGYLFGLLCNMCFGVQLPIWLFALAGMGAVMAGTIHAPLMSVFILCESTNTYLYLFPYIIVVGVSYATVKLLTPHSWYSQTAHDDLMSLLNRKLMKIAPPSK